MAAIKSYTDIEQSRKLAKFLSIESADMYYDRGGLPSLIDKYVTHESIKNDKYHHLIPCWSLAALLKLIPKRILRKDKIHYGQTFIPSFSWEINPRAIYYTDENNIMDYVSFRYGENNMELIDAVFKMVVWLKENGRI